MNSALATPHFSLCADGQALVVGQALALNFTGHGAPEWIQLLPAGPDLVGNDGRKWRMADPTRLVETFNARKLTRPIDINHSTHLRAPLGGEGPAAGWIEKLDVREGAIFGRVDWNDRGRVALQNRDYRYVSPSFTHDAAGNVVELVSAGLVNTPNFTLPALNSETVSMFKDLLKKLGLSDGATENDAIAAVDALQTARNAAQPDLNLFVPRADYALALNRAEIAEQALRAQADAARAAEVATLVDGAVKTGKIAPASKDFYLATCADDAGLARFRDFIGKQPVLFQAAGVDDPARSAPASNVALNADQSEIALGMGVDPKKLAAFLAAQKKD